VGKTFTVMENNEQKQKRKGDLRGSSEAEIAHGGEMTGLYRDELGPCLEPPEQHTASLLGNTPHVSFSKEDLRLSSPRLPNA
jgi:hypothetical protein